MIHTSWGVGPGRSNRRPSRRASDRRSARTPYQLTRILQQDGHADGRDDDVHQRNTAHAQRPVDAKLDRHGREAAEHHSDHQQRDERERQQVVRRDAKHRAQHDDLALREMQHAGRPDDHREAERDEAIDAANREATDKELDELRAAHRMFHSVVDHRPVIGGIRPIELKTAKIRSSEDHRRRTWSPRATPLVRRPLAPLKTILHEDDGCQGGRCFDGPAPRPWPRGHRARLVLGLRPASVPYGRLMNLTSDNRCYRRLFPSRPENRELHLPDCAGPSRSSGPRPPCARVHG
jgi:hypothetical protein